METKANYAVVGLFTLAVIAVAFGFVWWFAGRGAEASRVPVRIVFNGSVAGLGRGSSVTFNGLRVGEVQTISLLPEDPRRVVAVAQVDKTTPLKVDTRARLESQGLTGVSSIAMTGGEPNAADLTPPQGQDVPVIYAERSDFQDLFETVRTISRQASDVIGRVDRLIADNEGSLARTVRNVETFSQALSNNSAGINSFLASVGSAAEKIGPLAQKLEGLTTDLQNLTKAVDPQKIQSVVNNVDNFTRALGDNREAIDSSLKNIAQISSDLKGSAGKINETLDSVTNVTRAIDPQKIGRVVDNAERFSQALGRTGGDLEATLRNAASISAKLNASADRIDGVLKSAEAFLGSAAGQEGKSAFTEVAEASRSIRVLADNLDKRTSEITSGLTQFTGSSQRQLNTLTSDGARTLDNLNRVLNSLERNPQQLIFGGKDSIPQYNGRR